MLLKIVGSVDVLERAGATGGFIWDVSEDEPIGSTEQLDALRALLFNTTPLQIQQQHNPGIITIYTVRGGHRDVQISLSGTPYQNNLSAADCEIWVEVKYPSDDRTPSLAIHPSLAAFKHPRMMFIRIVDKYTQRGLRKHRILLLTTSSIYLSHPSGHTTRWLKYPEVHEAVVMPSGEGDWVLFRAVPPEHDLLVRLVDHHNNIPAHTTADELSLIIHRYGVKIVAQQPDTFGQLASQARLQKNKGFIPTARKLDATRRTQQNLLAKGLASSSALASSYPYLRPSAAQLPQHTNGSGFRSENHGRSPTTSDMGRAVSRQDSVSKRALESGIGDGADGRRDVDSEVVQALRDQEGQIASLKRELHELKRRQSSASSAQFTKGNDSAPFSGKPLGMPTDPASQPHDLLQLARSVLAATNATGLRQSSQNLFPAASPLSPAAPESKIGISKAIVIGVSLTGELHGASSAIDASLSFLRHAGLRSLRVLRDDQVAGSGCQHPSKQAIIDGFAWLLHGLSRGESIWVSFVGPTAKNAWSAGDGQVVSVMELQKFLISKVPDGVRLTVVTDGSPASPGPDLPFCLACVRGKVAEYYKDSSSPTGASPFASPSHRALQHAGETICMGSSPPSVDVSSASFGNPAGTLMKAYLSVLSRGSSLTYDELLTAVHSEITACNRHLVFTPVITSSVYVPGTAAVSFSPSTAGGQKMLDGLLAGSQIASSAGRASPPKSAFSGANAYAPHASVVSAAHEQLMLHSIQQPPGVSGSQHDSPTLQAPLMAPFVAFSPGMPVADPPIQQSQDQEYWRNMVSHAFFHPDAFKPPHVVVTSSHTGTQLHLNKDYVSAFVSQWPKQHYLRIILRGITTEGRREILRTFNVSPHFWAHVKSSLNELLGQRAVQQLLYPHSRDAQRENNVLVSCEQIVPAEDDIACNDEDWAHAVSAWEVEVGFAFAKGSLPVPLMPPFRLDDEDGVLPHDAKIADYLSSELSVTGDTASSVSFQYDTDFIRNLSYHSRLMQHAREPPLFIVEDTNISHPIMVNQRFLVQYVKAWSRTHPHIVWVHNADNCTLVAKCRVTSEYWRYCVTTAPSLMASMGDGNVLAAGDSCRLGTHFLTVTSSCSAESLHMWDAVWFALVAEWETSLPKVGPQWSPTKQLPSPSVSIKWSLPGNTVSPPPPPLSLLDKRSAVASFDL